MRDHSPPKRGTHKAISTMARLLPLAVVVIEEFAEAQQNPTAIIAVRLLLRVAALWSASKRFS